MSKVTWLEMVDTRHRPRQAACPEPGPHHRADGSSSCQPGPAACARAWRARAQAWVWFTWIPCDTDSWQPPEPGHPRYRRCSETPWARGMFSKEFHYTQPFAKVLPPRTLKNNLALEAKWPGTSGRQALGPRPVWGLRRWTGRSTRLLLSRAGWGGGLATQACSRDGKLRESLTVSTSKCQRT